MLLGKQKITIKEKFRKKKTARFQLAKQIETKNQRKCIMILNKVQNYNVHEKSHNLWKKSRLIILKSLLKRMQ